MEQKIKEQKLRIRLLRLLGALVEAVMKVHEIGHFQTRPPRLLIKGENGGPEVQDQGKGP